MHSLRSLTWDLCSGVDGGFGVLGSEPPAGVQCRSRARAVRSPSVTRLFYCFRFLAAALRNASLPVCRLVRRFFPAGPAFSPQFVSRILEIHSLSLAAGMFAREGVEKCVDPLRRAADCAARRLLIATFTISQLLYPHVTSLTLLFILFVSLLPEGTVG